MIIVCSAPQTTVRDSFADTEKRKSYKSCPLKPHQPQGRSIEANASIPGRALPKSHPAGRVAPSHLKLLPPDSSPSPPLPSPRALAFHSRIVRIVSHRAYWCA